MPQDLSLDLKPRDRILREPLYGALLNATLAGPGCRDRRLRILDVGAGRGELLQLLRSLDHDVIGLDAEPACVAAASRFAHCRLAGIEDVPTLFDRRSFDVVVCSHVLEHLTNPIGALEVLRRLLAERYVFAVPNVHRSARLVRALLGRTTPDHATHLHGWGRPEFEAALRAAGFAVERWYVDRVTVSPVTGNVGTWLTRVLEPVEVRWLPRILPTLSSSLIVSCRVAED